jgi:membrane-associated phospholipid phosphatase
MLVLSAAMLGLFIVLTLLVTAGSTQGLDDFWNRTMADGEVPWLVTIAKVFAALGSGAIGFATAVVVGAAFLVAKRYWAALTWTVMAVIAQVLSSVTKELVDRTRPLDGLAFEPSASFPSGHAMVSGAAMGIGLAIIAGRLWPDRNWLFLIIGTIYAVAMALSRTYLRVHWLTDVVGGLLFGAAVVLGLCAIAMHRSESHPKGVT